jgi:hypothetical protein
MLSVILQKKCDTGKAGRSFAKHVIHMQQIDLELNLSSLILKNVIELLPKISYSPFNRNIIISETTAPL